MNILVEAPVEAEESDFAIPSTASISNVEIVNLLQDDAVIADLDAGDFGDALQQIWQIDGATDISGLEEGVTAGFRDTPENAEQYEGEGSSPLYTVVTAAADATSISVALDGAGRHESDSSEDAVGLGLLGENVDTVNISGSIGTEGGRLALYDLPEDVSTINLAMADYTDVALYDGGGAEKHFGSVTTFDASASTGDINAEALGDSDAPGMQNLDLETVLLGSGSDTVQLNLPSLDADAVDVDLGAGNDVFTVSADQNDGIEGEAEATALNIMLGAGNDKITFNDLSNIQSASEDEFEAGLVTVADFDTNDDVLDMSGDSLVSLNNAQRGNIEGAESLHAALGLAAEYVGEDAGNVTAFDYEGDAYVLSSEDGSFGTGDSLIQLTGVSASDLDASAFLTA